MAQGKSFSGRERNCCFLNLGETRFADISAASGLDFLDDARALGTTDWDFDGDLDVWLYNRSAPRLRLMRNDAANTNHRLNVRLVGTSSNRDAVGARLELHFGSPAETQIQTLRAGEGFLSQSSKWVHFGLGGATSIDRLVVHWPGGAREEFRDLAPDQHYLVVEGSARAKRWQLATARRPLEATQQASPARDQYDRVALAARPPLPTIRYTKLDGQAASLDAYRGAPLLINIWATWCQPCLVELRELSEREEVLQSHGLQVVALHADLGGDQEAAGPQQIRTTLEKVGARFDCGVITPQMAAPLSALQNGVVQRVRPLAVPTSFLVDAQGMVAVVYRGRLPLEQLEADLQLLALREEQLRGAATPWPGRWRSAPQAADPLRIAMKMFDEGHLDLAEEYLLRCIALRSQAAPASQADAPVSQQRPLSDIYFTLARIRQEGGDRKAGLEALQEAIAHDPANRSAQVELGREYLERREFGAASDHLAVALRIRADDADVLCLLALAQLGTGAVDPAIKIAETALRLDPHHLSARYNLAFALQQQGRDAEAATHYREVLRRDPHWSMAANNLAWILATTSSKALRDAAGARVLADGLPTGDARQRPIFLRTRAAALAANHRFEAAIAAAEESLQLLKSSGDSQLVTQVEQQLAAYRDGRVPVQDPPRPSQRVPPTVGARETN